MNTKQIKNYIIYLSVAGVLFSGYLSAVKLFSQTCAIDSGCSYFLGYPTCYFGFGFFALLLILSLSNRFCSWGGQKINTARVHALRTVATLGIVFSAYFSAIEIYAMFKEKMVYGALILPTCFYGLLVYIAILYLAFKISPTKNDASANEKENLTEAEDQQAIN